MSDKLVTTVTTVVTKGPDWAATGAMLSGIGTVVGAIAVIGVALIGGSTFANWRRQQLLQRHMDVAEKVLTAIFKARENFSAIRSPLKEGWELKEAEASLVANGFDKANFLDARWSKMVSAQVSLTRLHRHNDTWAELAAVKPSAYVYFGEEVSAQVEVLQRQVVKFQVDVLIYAEDDGREPDFTRGLMKTMSRSRAKGEVDEFAKVIDDAIAVIEQRLKPLLTDAASVSQTVIDKLTGKAADTLIERLARALAPF